MQAQNPTPDRIIEIGYAYWKSRALLSAVEIDLFTVLSRGPLDCGELIARLGLAGRQARDFFDALVSLGLLARDEQQRYSNTLETGFYLDRGSANYVGGALSLQAADGYPTWGALTTALRTGKPQAAKLGKGFAELYADQDALETFLNGMMGGVIPPARALAVNFPWRNYRTVADIGAARGCCLTEIAGAHAHIRGLGFDLPPVRASFQKYVSAQGHSDRLRFCPGDFRTDPLPEADVLILGRILHDWDIAMKNLILRKAYAALPADGALIVYETLIDDQRRSRSHALLQSLNMLLMTESGFDFSAADCIGWLQEAGFRQTRVEPLAGEHWMVVATK